MISVSVPEALDPYCPATLLCASYLWVESLSQYWLQFGVKSRWRVSLYQPVAHSHWCHLFWMFSSDTVTVISLSSGALMWVSRPPLHHLVRARDHCPVPDLWCHGNSSNYWPSTSDSFLRRLLATCCSDHVVLRFSHTHTNAHRALWINSVYTAHTMEATKGHQSPRNSPGYSQLLCACVMLVAASGSASVATELLFVPSSATHRVHWLNRGTR